MKECCLCQKKAEPGSGSFFCVPRDDRRIKWSQSCGINFPRNAFVCMDHFAASCFLKTARRIFLLPNSVPLQAIDNPIAEASPPFEMQQHFTNFEDPPNCSSAQMACDTSVSFADEFQFDFAETQFCEKETQTDPVALDYSVDRSLFLRKVQSLEAKIKELERCLTEANAALDSMRCIFTEGQIRKMMSPSGVVNWRWADISNAICFHASGPRAYNHLYKKGFPLPHVSTLQRWCRKVNVSEGVLTTAIDFMQHFSDLEPEEKLCVLAFDEMKVMETSEYDNAADAVKKPANFVQVVMARGLRKSWKQPVFFNFDCRMTPEILNNIINQLHKVGFPVIAIVCDMGPTNRKLWKELSVSPDRPWFPSPINSLEKIFAFADAPHMLKLIRNHFLDSGLMVHQQHLTKQTFVDLLRFTSSSDASITFKLTSEHILVKGSARQNVKMAAQLFSNTTASAIRHCNAKGMDLHNAVVTADFVQLVNDWFDVHNSSVSTLAYPGKEPFGKKLEEQQQILSRMSEIMSLPILPNKKSLEHFQKGILISNAALKMLLPYVNKKYKMTYVCTNRLNQDILEQFFGAMRSKGGLNDHPSPRDFKFRMRKYILARNTEQLSGRGNVAYYHTEWLNTTDCYDRFGQYNVLDKHLHQEEEDVPDSGVLEDLNVSNFRDIGTLQEDALEYISGYIIRKLNLEEYESHENSYTWVGQISKGLLKKPSNTFMEQIKVLETVFYQVNGLEISHRRKLHQILMEKSAAVELPENIKAFFFRCRIYFRIRHLNQRLKVRKAKQRIMGNKKLIKINL